MSPVSRHRVRLCGLARHVEYDIFSNIGVDGARAPPSDGGEGRRTAAAITVSRLPSASGGSRLPRCGRRKDLPVCRGLDATQTYWRAAQEPRSSPSAGLVCPPKMFLISVRKEALSQTVPRLVRTRLAHPSSDSPCSRIAAISARMDSVASRTLPRSFAHTALTQQEGFSH